MWVKGKRISLFALVFILLSFVGCGEGEDTNNSLVDIYLHPSGPASVRKSSFTTIISGEEFTVNAPWFYITLSGYNNSEADMFVASLEIVCRSGNGQESRWTPVIEDGVVGIAAASADGQLVWGPRTVGEGISGSNSMIGYVGDLVDTGAGSLRYRCTLEMEGWFYGTEDDPETEGIDETELPGENFSKSLTFSAKEN